MKCVVILLLALAISVNSEECRVLMLSGGGSWGAYEAGVVSRLHDTQNYRWHYISGVSAGSINSVFLSALGYDRNISQIFRQTWDGIQTKDVYKLTLDINKGLVSIDPLVKTLFYLSDKYQLDQLYVPVFIGTTNVNTGVFTEYEMTGRIRDAIPYILASSSIPVLFPMYLIDDTYYVDGGLLHNVITSSPIISCMEAGFRDIDIDMVVLSSMVSEVPSDKLHDYNLFQYIERVISIVYQNIGDIQYKCDDITRLTARVYSPNGENMPSFLNFDYGGKMFDMGYNNISYNSIKVC